MRNLAEYLFRILRNEQGRFDRSVKNLLQGRRLTWVVCIANGNQPTEVEHTLQTITVQNWC